MVGIESHLGGQIEGDGEAGSALAQKIAIAAVALFGGAEAGILAHGPEAAAIHVRIDAAGVREHAGSGRSSSPVRSPEVCSPEVCSPSSPSGPGDAGALYESKRVRVAGHDYDEYHNHG